MPDCIKMQEIQRICIDTPHKTQSLAIKTHKRWRDILLNHKSSKSYLRVVSSLGMVNSKPAIENGQMSNFETQTTE